MLELWAFRRHLKLLEEMRFSKIGFSSHRDPSTMMILDVERLGRSLAGDGISRELQDEDLLPCGRPRSAQQGSRQEFR